MGVPFLTTTSSVMCPHGGQVQLPTTDGLSSVQRAFVLLETDVHPVVGCPFIVGNVQSPCVTVRWSAGATRMTVGGVPVLLSTSVGTCYSAAQAPQGVAIVTQTQQLGTGV